MCHREPSDRTHIAEAMIESSVFIAGDASIRRFDVPALPTRARPANTEP